jgi:CubicO group peptidase (beta-lactamase class C family)
MPVAAAMRFRGGRHRHNIFMAPFERAVDAWQRATPAPSLSVAVFHRGAVIYSGCYGDAVPATVYQTASLGKHFTAALAILLWHRSPDLCSLDTSITPHLPELPQAWEGITLRQLLSHTAGIPDDGYDSLDYSRDYTDAEIVNAIAASAALDFPPGTAWRYSNAGYVLAGIAIGRRAGAFYGDLLRESIFDPLGMTTATTNLPGARVGHVREHGRLVPAALVSPTLNQLADGGISLTIGDLGRWESALSGPWGARVAEMFVETKLATGESCSYGLGWSLSNADRGRIAEHDGMWQGFSSAMVRHLDEGLSAVVLADVDDFDAIGLAHHLIAAAGLSAPPARSTPDSR